MQCLELVHIGCFGRPADTHSLLFIRLGDLDFSSQWYVYLEGYRVYRQSYHVEVNLGEKNG